MSSRDRFPAASVTDRHESNKLSEWAGKSLLLNEYHSLFRVSEGKTAKKPAKNDGKITEQLQTTMHCLRTENEAVLLPE